MTVTPNAPYNEGDMLTALCVWREARGVCYEAKLGVVWTLRNRCEMAPAQGFKHDMAGNILKPWAFSSFNSDDPNSSKYPEPGPTWDDCLRAVKEGTDPAVTVPPAGFWRAVFYYSPPLNAPPHEWGPVAETCCVENLHFCEVKS